MFRSVDLFIRAEKTLAELAQIVRTVTGLPVEAGPREATFVTRDDHFQAVLHEHSYREDAMLSRYPYVLSSVVGDGARLQEAPATVMLRLVADQLQRQDGLAVLLILDFQYRERAAGDASPPVAAAGPEALADAATAVGVEAGVEANVDVGDWPQAATA